ncbi:hypothetical protein KKA14_05550 [bacterium]|nr:hypothetical protein [bacterium]
MKKVLLHTLSHGNGVCFDSSVRDACNEPYIRLREAYGKKGVLFDTADKNSLSDCKRIIFSEIPSTYLGIKGKARQIKRMVTRKPTRNIFKECIDLGMHNKMALILTEPPSVFPENWDIRLHSHFPVIFTWNDRLIDGKKYIKLPAVPQPENYPKLPIIPFSKKKLLVNISMNKLSSHPKELYSERVRSIKYFEMYHPKNFDLFGIGWNKRGVFQRNHYSSYHGSIANKWDVLPYYRFSICYENVHGELGYITEKIIDCLRCNCVPIYWGAENITDYVDKNAFIDRRNFKTNADLGKYLSSITEDRYMEYIEAIESFLNSKKFLFFLSSNWIDTIMENLN